MLEPIDTDAVTDRRPINAAILLAFVNLKIVDRPADTH
jgi:hypothetical protein